jgi:hypothetical protein
MFLSSEYVTRTSGKARGDEEAGEEEEEEREKEKKRKGKKGKDGRKMCLAAKFTLLPTDASCPRISATSSFY